MIISTTGAVVDESQLLLDGARNHIHANSTENGAKRLKILKL